MIIGITLDRTLEVLLESSYECYLTGSRYFGNDGPNSDWDFFVQDAPEVRSFLLNKGFTFILSNYTDTQCNAVLRKSYGASWIDIQLVQNASIKQKAQTALAKAGKKDPTRADWELAFQLLS